MKNKNNKYLIWGYYGFGNLGDESMLKIIVNNILNQDPDSVIYVRCFHAPEEKRIVPFPIEKSRINLPIFRQIVYIFRLFRMLAKIDFFIIGGGTLFLDKGKHNASIMFLAIAVFFARLMAKKVYIVGIGIDILTFPMNLVYLKYILKGSKFVSLRDDFSYSVAKYLSQKENITRTSDIIFENSFVAHLTKNCPEEKKYIVISITDYFRTWYSEEKRRLLMKQSVNLIKTLIEKYSDKYTVLLCAFQKDIGEMDYKILKEIRDLVINEEKEHSDKVELEYLVTEEQIQKIFGSSVFTIAMRYHALVLSAIFERPFLGIDIEMKIKEICTEFGMPFIKIDDFLADGIPPGCLEKLFISRISNEKLNKQMKMSADNFGWMI